MWETVRTLLALIPLLIRAQVAVWTAELSAELHRLVVSILWRVVLGIFGVLTVWMAAVTIVVAFWDHRVLAAGLVTALFASVTAFAAWRLRRRRRNEAESISAC